MYMYMYMCTGTGPRGDCSAAESLRGGERGAEHRAEPSRAQSRGRGLSERAADPPSQKRRDIRGTGHSLAALVAIDASSSCSLSQVRFGVPRTPVAARRVASSLCKLQCASLRDLNAREGQL